MSYFKIDLTNSKTSSLLAWFLGEPESLMAILKEEPNGATDEENIAILKAALDELSDEIDRRFPIPGKPKTCQRRWHAGMLQEHGAPEHGERCALPLGHEGHCSFILAAQHRGWRVPEHVKPGSER